jgi:ABC-type lipoprotein export system ATPase subunit
MVGDSLSEAVNIVARLRGASVRYPDSTAVLLPDLSLEAGQELALIGPSGSGKSTALHALAGLVNVRGEASCAGLDLTRATLSQLETHRARGIGLLFQDFHLLEGYTAQENVIAALGLSGLGLRAAVLEARRLLGRVGLSHRLHATPARLSTGERQRVALARALAVRPKLILADEPTAHLDASRAAEALQLLRDLRTELGAALLISTHDPSVIAALPNRISFQSPQALEVIA